MDDNASVTRATTLEQQHKHASLLGATTPVVINDGDNPLLQGQQCQLDDYASLTTAEMPSQ
jgi:hypothetical protein